VVEVKDGTITGIDKDNTIDNRMKDNDCIDCLRKVCGE
jgi:hypothetical protein